MSCLTKASHYEFASFAFQQGRLSVNAYYDGKGEGRRSNTFVWAAAHDWFMDVPTGWFARTFRWGHSEQLHSFLKKSISSRFNFVVATNTHGTDLMVFNSGDFTDKPFDWVEDGSPRDRKYDLFAYNMEYRKYALERFEIGLGPDSNEPLLRDFEREDTGHG